MSRLKKVGLVGIGLSIITFVKAEHSLTALLLLISAFVLFTFMFFAKRLKV